MLSSVSAISRDALALKKAAPKRAAALTLVPRYRFATQTQTQTHHALAGIMIGNLYL
jgi:hypothetical protein